MVLQKGNSQSPSCFRSCICFAILFFGLLLGTPILNIHLCASGKQAVPSKLPTFNLTSTGTDRQTQININRATVAELRTLPGIGEATAQRIVEYRKKNPPFRRIEELLIIRGISRNRLEQIRDRIRLD